MGCRFDEHRSALLVQINERNDNETSDKRYSRELKINVAIVYKNFNTSETW